MAKYTVTLHELLKNDEVKELIKKSLANYPMYRPVHEQLYAYIPTREELNQKILNHYRFYEIGSETVERFLFNIEMTMNEIMPYYNQLYKSVDIINNIDDIFGNVDITESFEQTTSNNSSSESEGNIKGTADSEGSSNVTSTNKTNSSTDTNGRSVKSVTPQSELQVKSINDLTHASEMGWNEDTNNSTSSSNDTSTSRNENSSSTNQDSNNKTIEESSGLLKHTLSKKGNQGVNTYAHDMLEFRQLALNVEQQIIHDPELAKCFSLIW